MATDTAFVAITLGGFVDGACFTVSAGTSAWIAEMKASGMVVAEVSRDKARQLWCTQLELPAGSNATDAHQRPGRMIVGRRPDGTVEAAGWDYPETRRDARVDWLERGLILEFVTNEQVTVLAAIYPDHVFGTTYPVGEVLSYDQAMKILAGF